MIKNYLLIAWRTLVKNKVYSLVNILGLAIGITACFFVFQYVHFEKSYDRFNTRAADIYRVPISYSGSLSNVPTTAANHPAVGPAMKKDFPEVVDYVRMVNTSLFVTAAAISYTPKNGAASRTFNEPNIFVTDESFFRVFSYPLLKGDRKQCLATPGSIVISASAARKYFGNDDPMGQTLALNAALQLKVTGVFADVPENSHIKFDMLMSFLADGFDWMNNNWGWPEFYTYVQLVPGTDAKKLEAKFPAFIEKYLGAKMKELNFRSYFHLQPLTDIHLKSNYLKEAEANGSEKEIYFLSIIGIFIMLIAWINYVNLSTAKSMERAREVGIRKVSGAFKKQLIIQFLIESTIINLLALAMAVILIFTASPLFNYIIGKKINDGFFTTGLGSQPSFWLLAFSIFIAGASLVGAYPAFVLSSFKPVKVLKGLIIKSNTGMSLRRVLVSFQFILSIVLIAATLIVFNQLNYMRNADLGYKKDQVLVIKSPAIVDSAIVSRYHFLKSEIKKMPFAENVSTTSDIPGGMIRYRNAVRRSDQDKQSNFTTYLMEIDDKFINTYHIEMLAGENFRASDSSRIFGVNDTKVLINEEIVKALGYASAEEAVNKEIVFNLRMDEIRCRVAGVVKNYHQRSLKEKYDPILYYYPSWTDWKYISVNIQTANLGSNLATIEAGYKNAFPGNAFEYFFQDDFFNRQYQTDQRLGNVFGLFAVLAIMVACLGLLGLSSFVIKVRTKEIGIRKVLGASVAAILLLISKDFVKLVFWAALIAIPVVYWAASEWLNNYAFHIALSWLMFVIPPFMLLLIALLTICLQSLKTALTNPVKSLRSE
ncbi:MAG: ABC transporter permease [Chitinophagaceae bacterium]|nr:ABC transporter permease [Chitinophagaceae bacterium]